MPTIILLFKTVKLTRRPNYDYTTHHSQKSHMEWSVFAFRNVDTNRMQTGLSKGSLSPSPAYFLTSDFKEEETFPGVTCVRIGFPENSVDVRSQQRPMDFSRSSRKRFTSDDLLGRSY